MHEGIQFSYNQAPYNEVNELTTTIDNQRHGLSTPVRQYVNNQHLSSFSPVDTRLLEPEVNNMEVQLIDGDSETDSERRRRRRNNKDSPTDKDTKKTKIQS